MPEETIQSIADKAEAAFWAEVVKLVPEATAGDCDAFSAVQFSQQCRAAVSTWVLDNAPKRLFREWMTIDFPKFLQDLGFEDRSYHNDLCAGAQRPLKGYVESDTGPGYPVLNCWEHERVEDRETPDEPRFRVEAYLTSEICEGEPDEVVYQGDDPVACEAAVSQWLSGRGEASA